MNKETFLKICFFLLMIIPHVISNNYLHIYLLIIYYIYLILYIFTYIYLISHISFTASTSRL